MELLELDLHGYTREAALTELADFLRDARDWGAQRVCVITGLGMRGETDNGVLYHAVRAYLNERGYEYTQALESQGGAGAVIVEV
jgi:DNA-nicking Smr family endonuclease